jgi:hypothetical protein
MRKRVRHCPNCGASLTCKEIRAGGHFPCPACKIQLQASEYYPLWTLLVSLSLAAVVFVVIGIRGIELMYALLIALYPVVYLAANYFKYLILPDVELYVPRNKSLRLFD